jgi:hypothetical protein
MLPKIRRALPDAFGTSCRNPQEFHKTKQILYHEARPAFLRCTARPAERHQLAFAFLCKKLRRQVAPAANLTFSCKFMTQNHFKGCGKRQLYHGRWTQSVELSQNGLLAEALHHWGVAARGTYSTRFRPGRPIRVLEDNPIQSAAACTSAGTSTSGLRPCSRGSEAGQPRWRRTLMANECRPAAATCSGPRPCARNGRGGDRQGQRLFQ